MGGDVAAGTGKSFNIACPNRIGTRARQDDRNCFGRIHGRSDRKGSSCYHDAIDLETHQLGRKLRGTIALSLCISVLKGDVLSIHVAKFAQTQPNSFGTGGISSWIVL
jgi:hypothetical protein